MLTLLGDLVCTAFGVILCNLKCLEKTDNHADSNNLWLTSQRLERGQAIIVRQLFIKDSKMGASGRLSRRSKWVISSA